MKVDYETFIREARDVDAKLDEVGRGRATRAGDLYHNAWRRLVEDDRWPTHGAVLAGIETEHGEDGVPPPVAPEPPVVAPLAPILGQLHFDGRSFADDTGPRTFISLHAGDLISRFVDGHIGDVHSAFHDARAAGYGIIRSWLSIAVAEPHPFWGDTRLDPNDPHTRERIAECIRTGAQDFGLRWHVALGDAKNVPHRQIESMWDWIAELVHANPTWFALVEGLNEAEHTGASDSRVVDGWVGRSRSRNPSVLHTLSAGAGVASEERENLLRWTPQWARHFYVHGYSGAFWGDEMRHAFSRVYENPILRNGWDGEPRGINWGEHQFVSGAQAWNARHPWRYALYMAQLCAFRQMPTFMCSHGVKLRGRFADAPGFDLAPRLIADLPADVMTFENIFHGGTTHRGRRVLVAPPGVRCDHAVSNDGRCVVFAYPDEPHAAQTQSFPVENSFIGRVHTSTGYTDVAILAGTVWQRDMHHGAMLVGRFA